MTEPQGEAALRDLERALAAEPGDGALRLRLALMQERAGRDGDALATLGDLANVQGAAFPEARALADALWDRQFQELELATSVDIPERRGIGFPALDAAASWLAFDVAPREADSTAPPCFVHDLVTGAREALTVEPGGQPRAIFAGSRGLVQLGAKAIVRIERRAGASSFTRVEIPESARPLRQRPEPAIAEDRDRGDEPGAGWPIQLRELSPRGDLVAANRGEGFALLRWPSLEVMTETESSFTSVSWNDERLITFNRGVAEVRTFAGELVGEIPRRSGGLATGFGKGFVSCGLELIEPRSGQRRALVAKIPERWQLPAPSLSSDGRGVRFPFGGRPRRVELEASEPASFGDFHETLDPILWLWHPHADVAALQLPKPSEALVVLSRNGTTDRAFIMAKLERAQPHAWSLDGHALLVERRTEKTAALEVWRTPTGRAHTRASP